LITSLCGEWRSIFRLTAAFFIDHQCFSFAAEVVHNLQAKLSIAGVKTALAGGQVHVHIFFSLG
jgi:hypothetical protein